MSRLFFFTSKELDILEISKSGMRTIHLTLFRQGKCPRISGRSTLSARNSLYTIGNSADVLAFNDTKRVSGHVSFDTHKDPVVRNRKRESARLSKWKAKGENRLEDKTRRERRLLETFGKREVQELSFHGKGN